MAKGAVSGLIWGAVVAGLGAGGLSLAYPDFKPGGGSAAAPAPETAMAPKAEVVDPLAGGAKVMSEVTETATSEEPASEEAMAEPAPAETEETAAIAEPEAEATEESVAQVSEPEVTAPEVTEPEVMDPETAVPEVMEAEAEPLETAASEAPDAETVTAEADPQAPAVEAETDPATRITDEIIAALPKPEGTVGNLAPSVTTDRLPRLSQDEEVDPDAPSALAPPPIVRFAAEYTAEEGKPLMSIVLIDSGDGALGVEALESFPYPLTFAVDANGANALERMQIYRDKGFEVLALVDLPRGATASDVEVAMSGYFSAVPEAVGILEGVTSGVQTSREMADQLTQIVMESGHGMLLQASGLNTARKLAEREGIPAATVFRDFDGNGQTASVMRRFLDQAAFRAGQEGGVVMMGRLQAETISALLIWGLADRASRVSLVPVSAVLTQ